MQQEYISRINTLFLQKDKLKCKNNYCEAQAKRSLFFTGSRTIDICVQKRHKSPRMKAFQLDIFRVLPLNFLARALLNTSSVRNVFLSLITTDTKVE